MDKNQDVGKMVDPNWPDKLSQMAGTCGEVCKDFGWAINKMKCNDRKLFRIGWNGKGLWIQLQYPGPHSKMTRAYIYMHTADNQLVPWVASQSDLLATDWDMVKE